MGNPTNVDHRNGSESGGNGDSVKAESTDAHNLQPTPYQALVLVAKLELDRLSREEEKPQHENPYPALYDSRPEASSSGSSRQRPIRLGQRFQCGQSVTYYDAKYSIWCRGEIANLQDYAPYAIVTPDRGVIEYYPVLSSVRRWEISFFPVWKILTL